MDFNKTEIRDMIISIGVLALIFSRFRLESFLEYLFIILAVFATHEIIGHKFTAQRYGCSAEYRMWPLGLFIGVITGFLGGIIFAAPGAVYISQYKKGFAFRIAHLSRKEFGIISLGGPLVNIITSFALIAVNVFYPFGLLLTAAKVSFFLALFNLLPIFPLDGSKVFAWDRKVWVIAFAIALIGLFS